MKDKSKGIFGKFIDITDESGSGININFLSHQDVRLNVIRKENKSSDITDENNKELTLLLSDIKSHFKKAGVPLNITQNDTEKSKTVTTGQNPGKAALSDAEIALQKMQFRAQELGAELVLTDRPAEMANERWRLPGAFGQENRSESMTAAEGLAKLAVAVQAATDQCSLQITLMIQPDLRPQVMLNVSAGEVNWIFAGKEGRYPLEDLLDKMAGKTTTHGWDAVVVYQRGQANMLLKQQHIKRFITGNVLAPLNKDIKSSDATRLQTHNLTLSAPHLSFDSAGTGDSMAQVGWDFVKGMIVFKQRADDESFHVKKIEKITPLNSPYISMKVPLSRARGSVSEIGEVQFDISEGDHFANNLVVNDIEQNTISSFFKYHFEATPDDQRIYKLGTISNYEHEQFQPETFEIRTMGAPNTASRGSQDEGDGAVVLFVQMKGSDSEPGRTEADWLLTDNYTSALVIGNKNFLNNIRHPSDSIKFQKYQIDNNVNSLWGVKSMDDGSGAGNYIPVCINYKSEKHFPGIEGLTKYEIKASYDFYLSNNPSVITPYIIYPHYDSLINKHMINNFHAKINPSIHMSITTYDANNKECISEFNVVSVMEIELNMGYRVGVIHTDETPLVSMEKITSHDVFIDHRFKDAFPVGDIYLDLVKAISFISHIVAYELQDKVEENINAFVINSSMRYIDTFFVQNMLFPEGNCYRANYASIPGDLLVMGKLGAGSESFAVTPTETNIVAGSEYHFKTTPEVSGVKWSISDSEKDNTGVDLGHIDAATGKYTAPPAKAVTEGVRHVVVCAEKGGTKVYALVSVLAHSVNISPAYQVIVPGKSSDLTAESLNGGELTWALADNPQGSALKKVSNNEHTYTAGKKDKKLKLNLERISVTDKTGTTTEAMILVRNVLLTGYIRVSYDNVPENSVQLTYFSDPDDAETAIPADKVEWTPLESGGATLDTQTGILSCNQPTDNGFAVISTKYLDEDEGALYCVIAIPLPLNTYKKTILAAYSPEQ